jgi:general secretion pathway protein G
MAIIATLLTLAVPRYFGSVDKAREATLHENLATMRDAIDKYYGDKGKYPETLATLVEEKYLRKLPPDPITESAETWVEVAPEDTAQSGVQDVKSGAEGLGRDGSAYAEW